MFVITLFVDTNVTLFLYVYTNVLNLTVISHLKGLNPDSALEIYYN